MVEAYFMVMGEIFEVVIGGFEREKGMRYLGEIMGFDVEGEAVGEDGGMEKGIGVLNLWMDGKGLRRFNVEERGKGVYYIKTCPGPLKGEEGKKAFWRRFWGR